MAMTKTVDMTVKAPNGMERGQFTVETALDTPSKIEGLSKRATLAADSGMFFDINGPFWMKDVSFPLDIVFMTKAGYITSVQNMPIDTRPDWEKTRYMDKLADYAIELPQGWCLEHGVRQGDLVAVKE